MSELVDFAEAPHVRVTSEHPCAGGVVGGVAPFSRASFSMRDPLKVGTWGYDHLTVDQRGGRVFWACFGSCDGRMRIVWVYDVAVEADVALEDIRAGLRRHGLTLSRLP